jgi:hypothetical protein
VPVARYESALRLALCLQRHPYNLTAADRALFEEFFARRVKRVGYPQIASEDRVNLFTQHFSAGGDLDWKQIKSADLLCSCHAESLPHWIRTKHILSDSSGIVAEFAKPTELNGRACVLVTFIAISDGSSNSNGLTGASAASL